MDRLELSEHELKAKIRSHLPPDAFQKRPWRLLFIIPAATVIVLVSILLVMSIEQWYTRVAVSFILGNLYIALMLFGHEVSHGAVTDNRFLRYASLYVSFLIYMIPPQLWRIWHNTAHHAHANEEHVDPDSFGTIAEYTGSFADRWILKVGPGSGWWASAISLCVGLTAQAQSVLWRKTQAPERRKIFARFSKSIAVTESALMAAFWLGLSLYIGLADALFVVLLPMLFANGVIMCYVVTNHSLCPVGDPSDSLTTTMSVRTTKFLDFIHLHFSHHVEHHLFPALSHRYFPMVRKVLKQYASDRYMAPPHWKALMMVFTTPKLYDPQGKFVNPLTRQQRSIANIAENLR